MGESGAALVIIYFIMSSHTDIYLTSSNKNNISRVWTRKSRARIGHRLYLDIYLKEEIRSFSRVYIEFDNAGTDNCVKSSNLCDIFRHSIFMLIQ